MIELIQKWISSWYKGDSGNMEWDPLTDTWVGTRGPNKHWTAKLLAGFIQLLTILVKFIKQEWKYFLTTFLTIITILIAVLSYIDKLKGC
ncbi:hypothetical protein [Acinetobacter dispersus]|uniref:hypothetical protein n=1 Tax=Acinetobacter dispersus TaxID=70348 RepID=UPI001F4AB748|nr:hypothetical protein [Acinetobacter dispersus]MCH7389531.1 hypothetical protein [Acinetobacter dispersus]